MKTKSQILFVLLLVPMFSWGQLRTIKGKVTAFNKYPIANIEVASKKSKIKTTADGMFEIEVQDGDKIKIKDPLFLSYEKKVTDETIFLNINLFFEQSDKNVRKAVEKGYFSNEDLDYGLNNLERENNPFCRFPNVYEAIRYAVPEARMVDNSSGGMSFILRGENSLVGNNYAGYLVNNNLISDISYIVPHEIKKIYKLSNSQASMYGSRAATGIIGIETF
ncbi:MAG: TonB-dependent receptor plug domain-containing protein [Cyclobacteriaceae bacterium]